MLIVDPWHWLTKDGSLPDAPPRLRRNALMVARLIEYGGPLEAGQCRETLVECGRRPKHRPCCGMLWVTKTDRDAILAFCLVCKSDQVVISNWQETEWAKGPMEPVRLEDFDERAGLH